MTFFQRVYSMHPLSMAAGLCLIALTIPAYRLFDAERANVGAVPREIDKQGDETRRFLAAELEKFRATALIAIAESRTDVLARVDRFTDVADQRAASIETHLDAHIVGLAEVADGRLAAIEHDANAHGVVIEQLVARELGRAVDGWDQVSTEATATLAETRRTVADLHPQALGLVAAAKVAAGEVASSGREFQRALPRTLDGIDRIVANSDRTTAASAQIAENFALASKPLPKWLRIVLAIAPPVAATGASAVGAGAALGAFR